MLKILKFIIFNLSTKILIFKKRFFFIFILDSFIFCTGVIFCAPLYHIYFFNLKLKLAFGQQSRRCSVYLEYIILRLTNLQRGKFLKSTLIKFLIKENSIAIYMRGYGYSYAPYRILTISSFISTLFSGKLRIMNKKVQHIYFTQD